ncbi:MAG TPA: PQQ-binding-like beta-propeller repeat protein [Tepidisphaeraceae bacterium]|nr:PQQ-binding-like beta-propeller repeat protein [Tepidisphaeraceae bacterium]
MNRISRWLIVTASFAFTAVPVLAGHDWPQWRGPQFDGASDASNLPTKLDKSTQAWETQLPGLGNGTPVIVGDRVLLSCYDNKSAKLLGMCISRTDGHVLWQKEVAGSMMRNDRNNAASPSAVADANCVFFTFATGDIAAFDLEGKPLWQRNLQKDYGTFNIQWIYSSSPLLYKGKLYVQVLQRDVPPHGPPTSDKRADSYLLALDPRTGHILWRQVRPNEAREESKESYATPVPLEHDGRSEIILVGGDVVTAHDADTGKELWRAGGWNPGKEAQWRLVPSVCPDNADGLVFACAPKGGAVMAFRDGGAGDVTQSSLAWKSEPRSTGISSDVCVPLLYKNSLYVLNGDRKTLYCLDPKTGKEKWKGKLGGNPVFRASPTGADDKIYCMNEGGDLWVLSADSFKILSQSSLGARPSHASAAVVDGMAIVRSGEKLTAFKK